MIAKAPLALGEEIRRLGYLEDGGWNLKKLESEFARMRERIGAENPHFESAFLTFDACTESVQSFFSQFSSDVRELWQQANSLKNDFEGIHQAVGANPSETSERNISEQVRNALDEIRIKAEHLENHILETVDPYFVARAMKMMRMAGMSFLAVAATAHWPKSPGRPETRIRGDKKSKMDYVRGVYLAHPDMAVEEVYIIAERDFHKAHPGKDFVKLEHVAKKFKKKIRKHCPGQLELKLSVSRSATKL